MAGMSAEEPFISLQNVRKVYRSKGAEFLAVSDVTMDVKEGELVSLVGPSGCGKTTVLKILAGLHDADGGTIKIGNSKTPFDPARVVLAVCRIIGGCALDREPAHRCAGGAQEMQLGLSLRPGAEQQHRTRRDVEEDRKKTHRTETPVDENFFLYKSRLRFLNRKIFY